MSATSPDLDNFIPDFNPQQELEAFMETIGNDNFQVRSPQPPSLSLPEIRVLDLDIDNRTLATLVERPTQEDLL